MKPQAQRELHYSTNQEVLDHLSVCGTTRWGRLDEQNDDEDFDGQAMDIDDVLRGEDVEFHISHAGGEFQDQLRHEMNQPKRKDTRRRRDVTQRRVLGFRGQMKAIINAYIKWAASQGEYGLDSPPVPPPALDTDIDGVYSIKVVDMFTRSHNPRLGDVSGQPPLLPFTVNPELGEEPVRPAWKAIYAISVATVFHLL
ncbi:hypothetical protein B0H13DRAFT_1857136 [Mycena leptocephala]|nr:hypothetical protein B0H13DRAFT_1857136 [Mycena leptocephala]